MAKLTAKSRKEIATKNFAIPGKKAYPIENSSHAKAALSMVSRYGTSAEKKEVDAKVHKKYPGIGKKSK
jgi:hypothetical protein